MKSRSFSLIMVFSVGLSVAVSSTVAGAGAGADFAGEEARVVPLAASMHFKDLFLYCCAVAVGGCVHLIFFFFFCLSVCPYVVRSTSHSVRTCAPPPNYPPVLGGTMCCYVVAFHLICYILDSLSYFRQDYVFEKG